MNHLFVSYEIAMQLKEQGFNDPCFAVYYANSKQFPIELEVRTNNDLNSKFIKAKADRLCVAPLYQQVIDWFREKHNIQIEILWRGDMSTFCYKLGKFSYGSHWFSEKDYKFNKYYEAFDNAINEALKTIK